jgi:hypothetical protein
VFLRELEIGSPSNAKAAMRDRSLGLRPGASNTWKRSWFSFESCGLNFIMSPSSLAERRRARSKSSAMSRFNAGVVGARAVNVRSQSSRLAGESTASMAEAWRKRW